eukprot:5068639-Amphidinium_carterae.1
MNSGVLGPRVEQFSQATLSGLHGSLCNCGCAARYTARERRRVEKGFQEALANATEGNTTSEHTCCKVDGDHTLKAKHAS